MTTHKLGDVVVEIDDETRKVTSIWPDGMELVAAPNYDEESIARARALGYGPADGWAPANVLEDAAWAMTADHDLFHHIVAQAQGARWSDHLRAVAAGDSGQLNITQKLFGDMEERMVLLLQRACNVGREGVIQDA